MNMKLLTVAMLSSSLLLTACNDDNDTTFTTKPDVPENNIKNPVVGIPQVYEKDGMSAAATNSVLMTYKMLGVNGKEVQATALVFTPPASVTPPKDGWRIVVWAHGTTGVADQCAPSQEGLQGTDILLKGLLTAGYVVVAPDYEGLGEPSGKEAHPFLNVKSEAYSITDAVVAARAYLTSLGVKTNGQWMTVGHSQGGQAALGAAQYASRAKLDYRGTVAIAPASNLGTILVSGEKLVENAPLEQKIAMYAQLDTYTALITAGLRNSTPALTYQDVFKVPTDQIASKADSLCTSGEQNLGQTFAQGMGIYAAKNQNLDGYPRTQTNFMTIPSIKTFLTTDSHPLQKKVTTPVIIYQGIADTTVPKQVTDLLVASARTNGTSIPDANYRVGDWDHTSAYVDNLGNIINDVDQLMPAQ